MRCFEVNTTGRMIRMITQAWNTPMKQIFVLEMKKPLDFPKTRRRINDLGEFLYSLASEVWDQSE